MHRLTGVLLILIWATAFGARTVLAPLAYGEGTAPGTLMFLRFVLSGVALAGTALTIGPGCGGQTLGIPLAVGAALIYGGHIIVGGKVMEQAEASRLRR
jgi:hypothetical protein